MKGIITKGIGGFYYVGCNGTIYECKPRGIFRKDNIKPTPGDYVDVEIDGDNIGTITSIYPRNNCLIRPPICNITQVVIITAVIEPQINYDFLNKIILMAELIRIKVILCFNKVDLIDDNKKDMILNEFLNTNYQIIFTSTKENIGIDELKNILKNEISVFSGSSGVGKSSLMNKIIPGISLETGELSTKVSRGKHTTRHVELFTLDDNSFIADTPGFSNVDITKDIPDGDLMDLFPEFSQYLGKCKFNTCLHHKEPGCEIKRSVEKGEISLRRYDFYIQCLKEIQNYTEY